MSQMLRVNQHHYSMLLAENNDECLSEAVISAHIEDLQMRMNTEFKTFEDKKFFESKGPIPMIDFHINPNSRVEDLIASYQGLLFQHMAQQAVVYLYDNTPMLQTRRHGMNASGLNAIVRSDSNFNSQVCGVVMRW